jgi:hypothetical protein
MRAFISIVSADGNVDELEIKGPLASRLLVIADHLTNPCKKTLDRLALLDRERTRGRHEFAAHDFVELIATAHALLADPPVEIRKTRKLADGPHPHAEHVAPLLAWLVERKGSCACVHYDLWVSAKGTTVS